MSKAANPLMRAFYALLLTLIWLIAVLVTVWAAAALYVDVRTAAWRLPLASVYGIGAIIAVWASRRRAPILLAAGFLCVLAWWSRLEPSNDGPWNADDDRTAWIDTSGDTLTIHNLRNCEYRTETDYTNCWGERAVHLSKLHAADFTLTTWGPKYIGHPIVSFDFGDEGHIAFSIEVRYRPGQAYSSLLGFFRQFALIFVVADERDVLRLRTNYRQGENVYLYRTAVPPAAVQEIFLAYGDYLNQLHTRPQWYNALTRNCTTTLDQKIAAAMPNPKGWNYQLLLNGTLDELLYSRGRLVAGDLPFDALKAQALINPLAHASNSAPDFSARIRAGRVGF